MDDPSTLTSSALDPLQGWVMPYSTLYPVGPCTHKDGSWSHHLVDDAEDPVDDVEDPGDGVKALVDDGETLDGLEKH